MPIVSGDIVFRLSGGSGNSDANASLGGVKSTQRTAEQTAIVRFWTQSNLGVNWFQAARQLATARKLDLTDSARMFALLSMGQANTFIVDWDAKFHYNF